MADPSDVDAAICARLGNDAALLAIVPNGVWYAIAPPGSQKFVTVTRQFNEDVDQFGDRAWERFQYAVKAVTLGTSGVDAKAAAARIDELLHDAVDLVVVGYHTMRCRRIAPIRFPEVEEQSDTQWQHRGGEYELWMQPITSPK
jgi:hypothetical protein